MSSRINASQIVGLLVVINAWLLSLSSSAQGIRYVKTVASGSGNGSSWQNATADLQGAIDALSALSGGGQVWVAGGLYKPTTSPDRSASFRLRNGVQVYGGFAGTEASLSDRSAIRPLSGIPSSSTLSGDIGTAGDNTDNVYKVVRNEGNAGAVVLDGFVISGGYSIGNGSLESLGAGLYTDGGTLRVSGCMFTDNVDKGSSGLGGAIFNNQTSLTVADCLFSGNIAEAGGGGVYEYRSLSYYMNCSFENNSSPTGGAVKTEYGSLVFVNTVFSGNTATLHGGACNNFSSIAEWVNCSFSGNNAGSGGVVKNEFSSHASLTNCVLYGNGPVAGLIVNDNIGANSTQIDYSLLETGTTGFTGANNLTTTVSPFVSTSSVALAPNSMAIDAGNSLSYTAAGGPPADLVGNPRIGGADCQIDMGAIEYLQIGSGIKTSLLFTAQPPSTLVVCSGNSVSVPVGVTGTGPLSYQWYKDGSPVQSQTAATLSLPNAQMVDAGNYSVVVTGACNSVTSTISSLTVNALHSVTVVAPPSATLTCANNSLTLTATSSATGLLWSNGETTASISVSLTGDYSVTATGANGCTAVSNTVTVGQELSLPPFTVNSTTVCQGQVASLLASSCSGQVLWSTGWVGASLTLTAGSSTSTLTATCTVGSCSAIASGSVVIGQVLPPPAQILSLKADESGCPVRLLGQGVGTVFVFTGPGGYVFSNAYRFSGTHELIGLEVKQPGSYMLTATYTNECGSSVPVSQTVTVGRSCP